MTSSSRAAVRQWVACAVGLTVGGLNQALAAAIRVETAEASRVVLVCEVGEYELGRVEADGRVAAVVVCPGTRPLKRRAYPELPWLQARVALPDAGVPVLRVLRTDSVEQACPPPLPSRGFISRTDTVPPRRFGEFYRSDRTFPPQPTALGPEYRVQGVHGVTVNFYPFQYDAGSGRLRICRQLTVEVGFEPPAAPAGTPGRRRRPGPDFARGLGRGVVNPEQLATATAIERDSSRAFPSEHGAMLIIAPAVLQPGLTEFITWKRERGLGVDLATYPTDTGSGTTALAEFVQARYNSTGLDFLILVGDNEDVPCRTTASGIPSDTMLTRVDGTDYYHDVLVSRLSARTAAEVGKQARRFVAYERDPLAAGDPAWFAKGTCVGSNEGASTSAFKKADREILAVERLKWLTYGFTQVDELYDPGLTVNAVRDAFNAGRGLVFYLGHGVDVNWRTSGFSVNDVVQLTNGARLPFVINGACHVGNFTRTAGDCMCEAFMRAGTEAVPAGAISTVGATTAMDWDPPIIMEQAMTELLTTGDVSTIGGVTFGAVQQAMDYCYATQGEGETAAIKIMQQTHLFGDCSLGLRTKPPAALTVTHDPVVVPLTDFGVTVTASGAALAGADVALYRADGVQAAAVTDAAGHAVLRVDAEVGDPMTLTVFQRDVVPYQAQVPVAGGVLRIYSNAALPDGLVGEPYSVLLRAAGGQPPYTWKVTTPEAFPTWLAVDSLTGEVHGTPAGVGQFTFTIEVSDTDARNTAAQAFHFTSGEAVAFGAEPLPDARVGEPYDVTISIHGSFPPFAVAVTSGELPAGVTCSDRGTLRGRPVAAGQYGFTVQATDAKNRTDTRDLWLNVLAADTITILTPADLPAADRQTAYRQALAAEGGTGHGFAWTIRAGDLPPGLSLDREGVIAGSPTSGGQWAVTIRVQDDADPAHAAEREFHLQVNSPVYFTATELPAARQGILYQTRVPATGTYTPLGFSAVGTIGYAREDAAASFAEEGVRQPWLADETEWALDLGFDFPFYNSTCRTVKVGDNGYLILDDKSWGTTEKWDATEANLGIRAMIAPFWNDLVLSSTSTDEGIYLARSADEVTVRWRGREFHHSDWLLNFSVTLTRTGQIRFRYGSLRTDNRVVIGISDGMSQQTVVFSQPRYSGTGTPPNAPDLWAYHGDVRFGLVLPLPAWLTLSADGILSGTPDHPGSERFTVRVTDQAGYAAMQEFALTVSEGALARLPVEPGWNCVALPLVPFDPRPEAVFAGQEGRVWCWSAVRQAYEPATTIEAKVGYWVLFSKVTAPIDVAGLPPADPTIPLTPGWNLIGPLTDIPLPRRSTILPPAWTWTGLRYEPAQTLQPGRGYWINAATADTLDLQGEP